MMDDDWIEKLYEEWELERIEQMLKETDAERQVDHIEKLLEEADDEHKRKDEDIQPHTELSQDGEVGGPNG